MLKVMRAVCIYIASFSGQALKGNHIDPHIKMTVLKNAIRYFMAQVCTRAVGTAIGIILIGLAARNNFRHQNS